MVDYSFVLAICLCDAPISDDWLLGLDRCLLRLSHHSDLEFVVCQTIVVDGQFDCTTKDRLSLRTIESRLLSRLVLDHLSEQMGSDSSGSVLRLEGHSLLSDMAEERLSSLLVLFPSSHDECVPEGIHADSRRVHERGEEIEESGWVQLLSHHCPLCHLSLDDVLQSVEVSVVSREGDDHSVVHLVLAGHILVSGRFPVGDHSVAHHCNSLVVHHGDHRCARARRIASVHVESTVLSFHCST
ncbi:hypothetical protein PMAYCL1PPCAC_23527, partial [Pristionchus mayeri]